MPEPEQHRPDPHRDYNRWNSRKLLFGASIIVFIWILLFAQKIPAETGIEAIKWVTGFVIGGFALEDASKRFNPFRLK